MGILSFLGFEFSPVKLDDRRILTGFLERYPQPLTGYTFAALAAWKPFFHYGWTFAEPDAALISCVLDNDLHPHLLQPIGLLAPAAMRAIIDEAADLPYSLRIIGVSERFIKENPDFAGHFAAREDRAVSNYVYSAEALAKLAGRKYAKKRNLLAQAAGLYSWSCQALTSANTEKCHLVLKTILEEERPLVEGMLERELAALEFTLRHFDDLHQQGLLISVEDKPVAFSIYEAISPSTVAIHFERALRRYKGLYQVINCETAKVIAAQGYEFINREEDLGDPGLRDAKMSYHPIEVVPAYELTFKRGN
ncbi:MAG: hypothetical protein H6Q07_2584 [Acidobacteria bacterium]|nr:hypothetical protein [Acidobacteriota bacterium]